VKYGSEEPLMPSGKIGVMTGGGDCPGLNAVIRAVVKSAILDHGYEVVGFEDGYYGLVKNRYRKLPLQSASGIITIGGTILGTSNKDNPFKFNVGTPERQEFRDCSGDVAAVYRKHKLDALIIIGGDGTLKIASLLSEMGLNVVGVPKTIDNDVMGTDVTFGFNSAVTAAMEAIDRIHTTATSHHRVMFVEVMGRYAGWIALEAGVAGGAEVILIPEIPFTVESICRVIEERKRQGKRFSIVVISEGSKPVGGELVVQEYKESRPEPIRLGGVGVVVAGEVEQCSGMQARVTVLGHLQRGGSPTAFDRILATRFGVEAVKLVSRKQYGNMVALRGTKILPVKIASAVRRLKLIPQNHPLIQVARSIGVSFGD
jgi:phosphofructokinase-like protein